MGEKMQGETQNEQVQGIVHCVIGLLVQDVYLFCTNSWPPPPKKKEDCDILTNVEPFLKFHFLIYIPSLPDSYRLKQIPWTSNICLIRDPVTLSSGRPRRTEWILLKEETIHWHK